MRFRRNRGMDRRIKTQNGARIPACFELKQRSRQTTSCRATTRCRPLLRRRNQQGIRSDKAAVSRALRQASNTYGKACHLDPDAGARRWRLYPPDQATQSNASNGCSAYFQRNPDWWGGYFSCHGRQLGARKMMGRWLPL
jgi:hypothetical protein